MICKQNLLYSQKLKKKKVYNIKKKTNSYLFYKKTLRQEQVYKD